MAELPENAILEFCQKARETGASYGEIITQLEITLDLMREEDDEEDESDDEDEEDMDDELDDEDEEDEEEFEDEDEDDED